MRTKVMLMAMVAMAIGCESKPAATTAPNSNDVTSSDTAGSQDTNQDVAKADTAASSDSAASADSAPNSDTAGADGSTAGGDFFFDYQGTMGGKAVSGHCVPGKDPAAKDGLGVTLGGQQINVSCPGTAGALFQYGGWGFSLDNVDNLTPSFTETKPKSVEYKLPEAKGSAFAISKNSKGVEIKATWDKTTRKLAGTIKASWGAPVEKWDIEGDLTGSFSVLVPK